MSAAAPGASPTEQDLQFRWLSGSVPLAFTATVGERWNRGFERLRVPSDLASWLAQSGTLPRAPRVDQNELEQARDLRESIHRAATALTQGRPIPRADQSRINDFAKLPTPVPRLSAGKLTWQAENPVQAALSGIAREAIALFTGPSAARIRECESPDCALLFVDASRPGRRRWCSSETCGSRSRSAAYRSRRG